MTGETRKNEVHGENQVPNSNIPKSRNYEILKPLLDEMRTEALAINAFEGLKNIPFIQLDTTNRIAEIVDRAGIATTMMQAWDAPTQAALARFTMNVKMPEMIFPDLDSSKFLALQADRTSEITLRALAGIKPPANLQDILAAGMSDLFNANFFMQNPLQEYIQKVEASLERQRAELGAHLGSVLDSQKLLENVFQSLNPATEVIRKWLAEQDAVLARAVEPLRLYFQQEEEAAEAFLYAGFCMAPSMDSVLVQRVKSLRAEKKKNQIAQYIVRYYQTRKYARMKEMVSGWESNSLFAPRMPIVRDALQAHLNRQFTLSIPVLLTQIEGVVGDFARYYDIPTNLTKKQLFTDTLDNIPSDWMRLAVHESVTRFVDATLYARKDFKTLRLRNKERINRHVVLHGRQVNYANERNLLRLFLLLDAFSALRIEPQANRKRHRKKPVLTQTKPK